MQTVLVTLDALRADHLGQYGYHRDTLPVADRLATEGYTFTNAFANGSYTRVSVPSLLTSSHVAYQDIGAYRTLPQQLASNGVTTGVVGTQTGIGLIDGSFGFETSTYLDGEAFDAPQSPLDRIAGSVGKSVNSALSHLGAHTVRDYVKGPYKRLFGSAVFPQLGYEPAPLVTDAAIDWVQDHRDEEFFLWVHYMDPHRPYAVHDTDPEFLSSTLSDDRVRDLMRQAGLHPSEVSSSTRQTLVDMYDSDIRYCSDSLGRFFTFLENDGIWDDALVILTSDHGEEFGEHGRYFHRNYP